MCSSFFSPAKSTKRKKIAASKTFENRENPKTDFYRQPSGPTSFFLQIRVARYFLTQYTKTGKNIPKYHNITQWPKNIINGFKILQITIKYTNKIYPNLDVLV
jgi:hypothetical protein